MKRATLALGCVFAVGFAAVATADDPAEPRAAVALTAAAETDSFVQAYLFEVAATVLRRGGFEVVASAAPRALLAAEDKTAVECAGDEACAHELATALGTPTILYIHASAERRNRISIAMRSAIVTGTDVGRDELVETTGNENAVAERIQATASALAERPRPCQLDVEAPAGLSLALRIGEGEPILRFPVFLRAGEHALAAWAPDRGEWAGAFQCEAGRRYRMRVR